MPNPRFGYTLFEVLLVLVILVVAASISIPVIDSMLADHRLTAGRDAIRARLADIRGRAMREGRPYKFSFKEFTSEFKIEPEDGSSTRGGEKPLILEGKLPEKVVFCKAEDALLGEVPPSPASDYETAVIYLADGTARDDVPNQILFGLQGTRASMLRVRPLTGAVSTIDKKSQEEQP